MELFDLVDVNDMVVGVTDKVTSHTIRQPHRVAAVFVFSQQGDLYVQVHKGTGGKYDHSVGGHVSRGETYAAAAKREAAEELGLDQQLDYLTVLYSDESSYVHWFGLFECVAEESWTFVPNEEVSEIIPMKLEDIRVMMVEKPEKFTTGFIHTMEEYCNLKGL